MLGEISRFSIGPHPDLLLEICAAIKLRAATHLGVIAPHAGLPGEIVLERHQPLGSRWPRS
jgi:hypothetical protein